MGYGLAIQPDGRLVVAGGTRPFGPYDEHPPDFALARYNRDGSLDTTFDGDGKVSTGFTPGWADNAYGIALAPDGRIVAAGWAAPDGVSGPGVIDVARYKADGSLDPSFDGDGTLVSAPTGDNGAFGVVVQPDGKIVVAGFVFGATSQLALVRYSVGGRLDWVTSADYGLRPAGATDLVRQPDGRFVVVGTTASLSGGPYDSAFAVARFESSGTPDRSFHGGAISTEFGQWDEAEAVALGPHGTIIVGGHSGQLDDGIETANDFAVARYLGGPPPCKVPNVRGKKLARRQVGDHEGPLPARQGAAESVHEGETRPRRLPEPEGRNETAEPEQGRPRREPRPLGAALARGRSGHVRADAQVRRRGGRVADKGPAPRRNLTQMGRPK